MLNKLSLSVKSLLQSPRNICNNNWQVDEQSRIAGKGADEERRQAEKEDE